MKHLFEEKGINNDVVTLSDLIADKILTDAPKRQKNISGVTGSVFVENTLDVNLCGEIKGIEKLKVHYILYLFDNMGEYSLWYRTSKPNDEVYHYNSYSDYDKKEIQIVSAYIDGVIHTDFAESILHEITHLYQIGMGMEKRVRLYEKVIEMCQEKDDVAVAVARTVYYTFKHEQDAMVHQFYANLLQNKPFGNVENILLKSEYGNALYFLEDVKTNKEEAAKYIKELGFTVGQWNKRIHYGYKRFKQKLYNAYLLYTQQNNNFDIQKESKTFEINLRGKVIFDEYLREANKRYGDIKLMNESIYTF